MRLVPCTLAAVFTLALACGCGQSLDAEFELAYLTFGKPEAPEGALVRVRHSPEGLWEVGSSAPLSRAAVLLSPAPYPPGGIQYLTIVSGYRTKSTSLWEVAPAAGEGPRHVLTYPERVVLLWSNNPTAEAAAIVFVPAGQTELQRREFGREAIALRPNAQCSVALVRYAVPESLQVVGPCRYARAGWFSERRFGYISRSGHLLAVEPDSGTVDTLAKGVAALATAPESRRYAVAYEGDSIAVRDASGAALIPTLQSAAVPVLAPDARWLAYHSEDHGVWILDLASGQSRELGLGYPIGRSPDGSLLLYYERKLGERNVPVTWFHVAAVASGATSTLPADGFIVDAVLVD